jgi:hypothetical protein
MSIRITVMIRRGSSRISLILSILESYHCKEKRKSKRAKITLGLKILSRRIL